MSLADELLADLEEDDNDEELLLMEKQQDEEKKLAEMETDQNEPEQLTPGIFAVYSMETDLNLQVDSIREVCKLRDSDELKKMLAEMREFAKKPRNSAEMIGNVESDPEYQLIVQANGVAVEIDNEIVVIHRFVKDKYKKRFPELDSLVMGELDFIQTVKELGNDLDRVKNNEKLQQTLTQATIMVVSVTASTTQGQILNEAELKNIQDACDMALELCTIKTEIYDYVESRMTFIAPNLTVIVGASTAAKILGIAGGLTKLSKMPSCNVQVLGSQKKTLSGFSRVAMLPHTGFVYYSDIVQDTAPDLRRKAARLVAAKCTLAARVDACHESIDGRIGQSLREDVEKKLDKLQEPPPVKFVKPLPKPIEGSKKKRGGRRVRKMKERYEVTEFRKQANRMNFGDIEEDAYQNDLGYTRGVLGKSGTGRIRLPQVDEKTKVRISKTLQKNLQKQQMWGGSTTVKKHVSGTASSVAFTPLQGLEIVNPQAAERAVESNNAKYFSNTSGFMSVRKDTT